MGGEDIGRSQRSRNQRERTQRKPVLPHLGLELPSSRTVRNESLWFKPQLGGLWYFDMAALADEYSTKASSLRMAAPGQKEDYVTLTLALNKNIFF